MNPILGFLIRFDVQHVVVHGLVDLLSVNRGVEIIIALEQFELRDLRQNAIHGLGILCTDRLDAEDAHAQPSLPFPLPILFILLGGAAGAAHCSEARTIPVPDHR